MLRDCATPQQLQQVVVELDVSVVVPDGGGAAIGCEIRRADAGSGRNERTLSWRHASVVSSFAETVKPQHAVHIQRSARTGRPAIEVPAGGARLERKLADVASADHCAGCGSRNEVVAVHESVLRSCP